MIQHFPFQLISSISSTISKLFGVRLNLTILFLISKSQITFAFGYLSATEVSDDDFFGSSSLITLWISSDYFPSGRCCSLLNLFLNRLIHVCVSVHSDFYHIFVYNMMTRAIYLWSNLISEDNLNACILQHRYC